MRSTKPLLLSCVLFCTVPFAPFTLADDATTSSGPSTLHKVEHAIDHGVTVGAQHLDHGMKIVTGGIERGAKAAERGVARGAQATAHGVETVTQKAGLATASSANQGKQTQ